MSLTGRTRTLARARRGTALVSVMVVTVGIVGMLLFLFTLNRSSSQAMRETRELVDVNLLLRAAIADAYEEILTKEDASTDGVGNIGIEDPISVGSSWVGTAAELAALGKEVHLPHTSRRVGRYLTVVESLAGNERVLHVVAAYPNFESPQQIAGAELRYSKFEGGKNALTMAGEIPNASQVRIGNSATANDKLQSAYLRIRDPSGTVPAMNVTAQALFDDANFSDLIQMLQWTDDPGTLPAEALPTLEGASYHADSPPFSANAGNMTQSHDGGAGGDWDTISRYSGKEIRLNQDTVMKVTNEVLEWMRQARGATDWDDSEGSGSRDKVIDPNDVSSGPMSSTSYESHSGTWSSANQRWQLPGTYDPNNPTANTVYIMDSGDADIDYSLAGTGILIFLGNDFEIKDNAELIWEGEVIFVATSNDDLRISHGGVLEVRGNMYMVMDPADSSKTVKLTLHSDDDSSEGASRLKIVDGTFMMAATESNKAQFIMESHNSSSFGSEVDVQGLFVTLGERVEMQFQGADGDDGANHGIDWRGTISDSNSNNMANFYLTGSMVLVLPEDNTTSSQVFEFNWIDNVFGSIAFDDAIYSAEFDELVNRIPSLITWDNKGYVEVAGITKLTEVIGLIADDLSGADGSAVGTIENLGM
jgi:hypothetical protein